MYIPAHFEASAADLAGLLAAPGLADLISLGPDGLLATPLPLLFDQDGGPHGSLQGHVARNNPHWHATGESLAILRGPDAYVSPAWYPAKAEHGRVVPTWNYLTAHVYGTLLVHHDERWLRELVTRLTAVHEAGVGSSWQVSDAPAEFVAGQLRAIVGVELVISRIEAKAKLSQNRSEADQQGVVSGLGADSPVGRLMS